MKKEIPIILIIILIIGGIFYWVSHERSKILQEKKKETLQGEKKESLPVLGLGAKILEVNFENNYLIVKPAEEEKKIKVNLGEDTKIIKLKSPPDLKNLPLGEPVKLEEEEIKIQDLKIDENIIIRTSADIRGKSEFSDVISIKVLP